MVSFRPFGTTGIRRHDYTIGNLEIVANVMDCRWFRVKLSRAITRLKRDKHETYTRDAIREITGLSVLLTYPPEHRRSLGFVKRVDPLSDEVRYRVSRRKINLTIK
jgi:hypothetical protein